MEEKYEKKLLRWLTYLAVPTSILFIVGYLIGDDIGVLLMTLGFIIPFTSSVMAQISLKYGGKYILSIASLGGLSFGMMIMVFGNILNLKGIENTHYILLAVTLMGIFAIAFSRRKFSERDRLIRAGMSMMLTFTGGAVVGVILAILFSIIAGGIGALIGFLIGIVLMVSYFGMRLGENFNLDEREIYSQKGAGIIGAGIGGILGVGIDQMYTQFYSSFYYTMGNLEIPLTLVVHVIAGAITGFSSSYLTQKMKKEIDKND